MTAYPVGSTVELDFTTTVDGVPTTLASGAISVKKGTTESTSGITTTLDDDYTGCHHVLIDTSADGTFYAVDKDFSVVITTGTLGGVSQVGAVVGGFRLVNANTGGLGALADVAASATEATNLIKTTNAIPRGTVTTGASTTSVPTSALSIAGSAASGVVADQFKGRTVLFDGATTTAGLRGASSTITANTASNTPTLTVDPALPATPASGDLFSII